MRDSGRAVSAETGDTSSNLSTLGFNAEMNKSIGLGNNMSEHDLLTYMADILLELEEMAVFRQLDGVADLIGCAHRAVQRSNRQ